jgi:hypothetical protein
MLHSSPEWLPPHPVYLYLQEITSSKLAIIHHPPFILRFHPQLLLYLLASFLVLFHILIFQGFLKILLQLTSWLAIVKFISHCLDACVALLETFLHWLLFECGIFVPYHLFVDKIITFYLFLNLLLHLYHLILPFYLS